MIKFAKTTTPLKPKNDTIPVVALMLAGLLTIMAVLQLFTFEKFIPLFESFGLAANEAQATLLASIIVIAEVFALPFLLRMYLSVAMRIVSMVMGWLAAGLWLYIMVSLNVILNTPGSDSIVQESLVLPVGLWGICFALSLVGLTAWMSWGMWPLTHAKKRAKK